MLAQQRARFAYLLVLPAVVLITLLNLYPLVEALIVSFQRQNMVRADPEAFVGLAHYAYALFEDERFWASLWRTVLWTVGSVVGGYLVGLSLALLLDGEMWGRTVFRALFLVPWVIPEVATAMLWKWLYVDEFGAINFVLARIGLIARPIQWLGDPALALPAVILVQVWKLYPIMFVVLLAALQNVPKELHQAAELDGAGPLQRFRYVTFPVIRPTSVVITLLAALWTFQNFEIVYLLTGGGPADATKILSTLVYEKAFWALEIGYATAIAMLMLVCLALLSMVYMLVYRAQGERA